MKVLAHNVTLHAINVVGKASSIPQLCKWNAFTIDTGRGVCEDCGHVKIGKNFSHPDWGAQLSR
jgi:hypothetical protein